MSTRRITIVDIAKQAGVSVGTVSRVLNQHPSVKSATRDNVLAIIERLQYRPDPIARSMISKRTCSIGVLTPILTTPFFVEVLNGIAACLRACDYDMVLYQAETSEQRDRYFHTLPMQRKIDGLLIVSLFLADSVVERLQAASLPTVLVDAYNPHLTSLVVDNVQGSYDAIQSLIRKGHRRIGFINGKIKGDFRFNQTNDRLTGVQRALGEAQILFEPELVVVQAWSRQGGKDAAHQLLSLDKPPTAIFAASDTQAIGALEVAREYGLRVPEDLSVIGFDGIEMAELLELSTVQQPMYQMGVDGAQRLVQLLDDPQSPTAPEFIRYSPSLIERRTTMRTLRPKTEICTETSTF